MRTKGALRFNQLQGNTHLTPTEVNRILHDLTASFLLTAKMVPGAGKRAFAEYHLTKAGTAHLKAFDVYAESLRHQAHAVGERTLRALESLYA
ncbi:MAG TPA: hypothetical protein VI818_02890 [Candidatus Thermoplasmatota archaeon]|nr:hypothetical protein [Candidatus Thermoplasmatota archaeon]